MTSTRLLLAITLGLLCTTGAATWSPPTAGADEPLTCCGSAAQLPGGSESADKAKGQIDPNVGPIVCPQYRWMTYANYCSFYALKHPTCQATNYDGDCNTTTGGNCLTGGQPPCIQTRGSAGIRSVGNDGYQGNRVPKHQAFGIPGPFDPFVGVTPVQKFVIKFKGNGADPLYAQIFVAWISHRGRPLGIVARGTEINPVPLNENDGDMDYSSEPLDRVVERVPGRPHTYRYQHGSVAVEIITNHGSPGHGKP
jgi:hypothetical protein